MKFFSSLTAVIMAAASLTHIPAAKAETAADDTGITLSDMVIVSKYLHGTGKLSEQAFHKYDLNNDDSVDSLDLCLFRKKIISQFNGFTKNVSELQCTNVHPIEQERLILSEKELEYYFGPLSVVTVDGDGTFVDTTDGEDIAKFKEMYNEEFFNDNILLLKTVLTPNGLENKIGNIYYSGQTINAEYYQTVSSEGTKSDEENYQLLQIVIPKTVDIARNFEWVYKYPIAETDVKYDSTKGLTTEGWKKAISGTQPEYFTSKSEFGKWIEGKFFSAVERSLAKTYNEDFFTENDLVIDLCAQNDDEWYVVPEADITADSVTITYSRDFIGHNLVSDTCITQVAVPKGACTGHKVITKRNWEEYSNIKCNEYALGALGETSSAEMTKVDKKGGRWVNSQAELDEYLSECLTDKAIELIDAKLDTGSAYVWLNSTWIGVTDTPYAPYISDIEKTVSVIAIADLPLSDNGGPFLHIIYAPESKPGYDTGIIYHIVDDNLPTLIGGNGAEIDFGDKSENNKRKLSISQYSFGDEYSADLYISRSGNGTLSSVRKEYLGTFELSKDFIPFSKEYTSEENEDGSTVVTGDNFKVTYKDGILNVSCRTSPDSDYTSQEFDIGK